MTEIRLKVDNPGKAVEVVVEESVLLDTCLLVVGGGVLVLRHFDGRKHSF